MQPQQPLLKLLTTLPVLAAMVCGVSPWSAARQSACGERGACCCAAAAPAACHCRAERESPRQLPGTVARVAPPSEWLAMAEAAVGAAFQARGARARGCHDGGTISPWSRAVQERHCVWRI